MIIEAGALVIIVGCAVYVEINERKLDKWFGPKR